MFKSLLQASILVLFISILSCSNNSGPTSSDDPIPDPNAIFNCDKLGYPCSLAEVPVEIRQASLNALENAYDALEDGTMADAIAILENRDDIVALAQNGQSLMFRLEGGGPNFLYDITGLTSDTTNASKNYGSKGILRTPTSVVGEDRNGDGQRDNRDPKKALFMSPYLWQFSPWDESEILASNLGSLSTYDGNVDYVSNPTYPSQNITIEDWRSWYLYDMIYVSTHGTRVDHSGTTYVALSSGVRVDGVNPQDAVGAWYMGLYDSRSQMTSRVIEYGLLRSFFIDSYGDGLDDSMVIFSACQTGGEGAGSLADAIGGDNFVMMAWSEKVYSSDAFTGASYFIDGLTLGLRAEESLDRLIAQGLHIGRPVVDKDGTVNDAPVFTHFAPAGGDQRLFEVPIILGSDGEPMTDGGNLSPFVQGVPDDGDNDFLNLSIRLNGIEEGTESGYTVRYLYGDQEASGTYDLSQAVNVGDASVEVEHRVDMGIDLSSGTEELTAIVALPEGGESRYVASTQLFTCSIDGTASGALPGQSDYGTARFGSQSGGRILFSFSAEDDSQFGTRFNIQSDLPLQTGSFEITSADILNNYPSPPYAFYVPGDQNFDCESCGGTATITAVDESGDYLTGNASYTMVTNVDGQPGPLTTVDIEFRAAYGDGTFPTAFDQCQDQYRNAQ